MELKRRYVFKGYASAVSGLIYVPKAAPIDIAGSSCAVGVAGGRSRSEAQGGSFADAVRFASATTECEALFDDVQRAKAVVSHRGRQDELTSTTTVTADIREMTVGNNRGPFFTAKRLRATLVSRSPDGGNEPKIAPSNDTVIEGVAIDGHRLALTLDLQLFQTCDTRSKLVAAADDPKVVKRSARNLVMTTPLPDGPAPIRPRLLASGGTIYTTIVRNIRWSGKPYPGAKIDEHCVIVPDFGRIFFGELLIGASERRLTLARFELGSPLRGYVGGGDVGSNGGWFP